jgi:hypothetical protein
MNWNLKEQLYLASWLEENPATPWEWADVNEVWRSGSGSGWNPFEAIRAGATIRLCRKNAADPLPMERCFTLEEITLVFTAGYHRGHNATVEASFFPIHPSEYGTFWKEDVRAVLKEIRKAENEKVA